MSARAQWPMVSEYVLGLVLVAVGLAFAAVHALMGVGPLEGSAVGLLGTLLLLDAARRNHDALSERPDRGRNHVGPLPLLHAASTLLFLGVAGFLLASWAEVVPLAIQEPRRTFAWLVLLAGLGGLTLLSAALMWMRVRILQPGTSGRGRLLSRARLAVSNVPLLLASIGILAYGAQQAAESGFAFTHSIDEAWLALDPQMQTVFLRVAITAFVLWLIELALLVGAWFLLPKSFRFGFWVLMDLALLGAVIYVSLTLPIEPATTELEDLREPMIRLLVTALFSARLLLRAMPLIMGLLGRLHFRTFVAARHLRSKKSGFLAAIGGLSILAVAMSSCMLTTVLSVMGGFRDDLKQKILGNHAHVVIDREHEAGTADEFEGWGPTLDAARGVDGVLAATPYVEGEVMVTSASNRSTALLRGIDVDTIGDVTDLEANLTNGRLEYLRDPAQLLNLPAEERRSILPLELFPEDDDDDPLPPAHDQIEEMEQQGSLIREVDRSLDGAPFEEDAPDEDPDDPAVVLENLDNWIPELPSNNPATAEPEDLLPGIIVGKELARTLRLFVGDEIDVVSPLGELGPAGPMPKARRYRVAGVFYSGMYEYDMKLIYVTLPSAQRFLNAGDAISGIEIKVDNVEQAPAIAQGVREAVGRDDLRVQDWQELNKNLFGALALEKLAMFVVLGFAVLIAGFCVFGTLTLMVQEKGREVGILKAMGATSRSIVGIFMFEGFLIGIFGAISGLGLGYLVVFVLEKFGIRLNPEVYYIDRLPVHIDPMEFAIVGASAVVICLVATIFPALLASRMRPIEALRHF